ncbi:MAG: NADH-quinone oxidoreductase subunit J [Chitinophagales bacterium]|nr:NADH-quinone oxidoreductase subunit J [Chitinophagales bacterium]
MTFYIFLLLSALAVFCGLMTVTARNPIYSVIYLIGCFFAVAGHYLLLNAQFLAIVHIIVYAGAIMVLFLFTLMMMNLNREAEAHKPALARIAAVLAAGLLLLVLIAAFKKTEPFVPPIHVDGGIGLVKSLGHTLLNEYLLPFEFASILLLAAMIGAVLIAKKDSANALQPKES